MKPIKEHLLNRAGVTNLVIVAFSEAEGRELMNHDAAQRDLVAEVEAENGDLRKRLATANDLLDPVSDVLNRKIDQLVVLEAENERLRKAMRHFPLSEAKCLEYLELGEEVENLRTENKRLRAVVEAAREYVQVRHTECTHGHPEAAWMDGVACHDCATTWIEPWDTLVAALDQAGKPAAAHDNSRDVNVQDCSSRDGDHADD